MREKAREKEDRVSSMRTGSVKRVAITLCALLSFIGGAPVLASQPVVIDRIVAVVNGEIITLSDLQRELSKHRDVKDEHLMLEDMIDRKLQMAEAKRNGLDVTDKELSEAIADILKRNHMDQREFAAALAKDGLTVEQYRTEFREQMTISRLFNKYVRTGLSVDEKEARAYYEKNRAHYTLPEEVHIRHLVIALPQNASAAEVEAARSRAEKLLTRLRAGEDFVRLIRENSSGPTAAQDGDLGFLQRAHALPAIADAAMGLKAGEYAGPIRTSDGFQIIKVEEVRTPTTPFEKVKDEITKTLFEQKMDNSYRTWLQTLRTDSHIENRL
jgi:peptidyl-prolyl cis-trans isomerase SurA